MDDPPSSDHLLLFFVGEVSQGENWKSGDKIHRKANCYITHRIHGAGIYTNIGGILMVNVTIYSIHGSYGLYVINPFLLMIL